MTVPRTSLRSPVLHVFAVSCGKERRSYNLWAFDMTDAVADATRMAESEFKSGHIDVAFVASLPLAAVEKALSEVEPEKKPRRGSFHDRTAQAMLWLRDNFTTDENEKAVLGKLAAELSPGTVNVSDVQ